MKPKRRRRHLRKTNARKPARHRSQSSSAKAPRRKPGHKAATKRKQKTSFEKSILSLKAEHEVLLITLYRYALRRARQSTLPEAEAVVLEALVRAVAKFRSRCRSEDKRRKALFFWVRRKIDYALRNLAATYPASAVRDAFVAFERRFGHKPTLRELCKFGPFNPRHVLNVWDQVARELDLTQPIDTVMQSLLDELAEWFQAALASNTEESERVRQVLAQLSAGDACLLILKYLCGYSEEEILCFLDGARDAAARSASQDDLEDLLDQFVQARVDNLAAPWDSGLLAIHKRGHLAIRLLRGRARFCAIYLRLDRPG